MLSQLIERFICVCIECYYRPARLMTAQQAFENLQDGERKIAPSTIRSPIPRLVLPPTADPSMAPLSGLRYVLRGWNSMPSVATDVEALSKLLSRLFSDG